MGNQPMLISRRGRLVRKKLVKQDNKQVLLRIKELCFTIIGKTSLKRRFV